MMRERECIKNIPRLAKEFDKEKNAVQIDDVTTGSNKIIYWICQEGHRWGDAPAKRIRGKECPYCSGIIPISGVNDLTTLYPQLAQEWHPAKNGDLKLENFKSRSNKKVWWVCPEGHEYESIIGNRTYKKHGCPYCSGKKPIKGENDLATLYPDIAKEWHPTKNGDSKPEDFKSQSNKKIWWVCPEGHEYESIIGSRTYKKYGCPYCAGNIPIKGENDLATLGPDIAKEWHPTKNGDSKPEDFKLQSNKKAWWLCPRGHEYESVISSRTALQNGCPYCSGRKVIEGKTDLESQRPDIAKEWHPTKNGNIKPNTVAVGTSSKYWWLCSEGHEYKQIVFDRTRRDRPSGCPYCSGSKPIVGVNDFGTLCKESHQFWDYDMNDTCPSDYLPQSQSKVWMKCDKGHSWNTVVQAFAKRPKCPYCSGIKVDKGINSLRVLYPEVAEKWDYEKNFAIDIETVRLSATKKYWWKCEKGHSWITDICCMIRSNGKWCPYCAGRISKYSI